MDRVKCAECNKQNRVDANFCAYCGVKINYTCSKCWMENRQLYTCGFGKYPGYKLPVLEKSKEVR